MNTILNSLSEADKNKSFLTIYKDGADFDIKMSDFASAISKGSLKLLNGIDLSASLTEVTDSIGTSSVLNLSTTQVNIGGGTALGRLAVRGDGTNPVARFEDSSGTLVFSVNNTNIFAVRPLFLDQINAYSSPNISINGNTIATSSSTITTGSFSTLSVVSSIGSATGNANYRPLNLAYTINNSGVQTGNATGLFLNATETALNGITHNLLDLQVGGLSKFRVRNNNNIDIYNNTQLTWVTYNGYLYHDANNFQMSTAGSILFTPVTGLLKIGGTTSSFPAIKRNGAAIDFRLADDSAFCNINAANLKASIILSNLYYDGTGTLPWLLVAGTTAECNFKRSSLFSEATGTAVASAQVQIDSTTKGFLMPRMTTAQINAIVTPANGLQVYNTTISHACCYQSGAWVKFNHSPM